MLQVRDEVEPLSDVGRSDCAGGEIGGGKFVPDPLKAVGDVVVPSHTDCCIYLLPKDDPWPALLDESKPSWPKMPLVRMAVTLTRCREWLTWATPGPDFTIIGPSGEIEGVIPHADAGEEVTAVISAQVSGSDVDDASLIDIPGGNVASADQLS